MSITCTSARSTTQPSIEEDPIPKLIGIVKKDYQTITEVSYCCYPPCHNNNTKQVIICVEVIDIAVNIFKNLSSLASSGETKANISITPLKNSVATAHHFSAINALIKLNINVSPWKLDQNSHGTMCSASTQPTHLTFSWSLDNSLLLPKPALMQPISSDFGNTLLNKERKEGLGTDCIVSFGEEHSFPAHKLFVRSFCKFFQAMVDSGMKEGVKGTFDFPRLKDLSHEALEALMTFMYCQKIDFKPFSSLTVLSLLEWSFEIDASALKAAAFNCLYERAQEFSDEELLHLLYVNSKHNFNPLKELATWLSTTKPQFYTTFLGKGEISSEDLLMLFSAASESKDKDFQAAIQKLWATLETKERLDLCGAAVNESSSFLEFIYPFCKQAISSMSPEDPLRNDFVNAFKALHDRSFEMIMINASCKSDLGRI